MSEQTYFFDTYAFFEIINGNPNYERYKHVVGVTTIFNLAELNYGLKKKMSDAEADAITEKYRFFLVPVVLSDVKQAMSLKKKCRTLSIPDCVGYLVAKRINAVFLTGDEGFRGMENVELVKK
ncbi:PIN domain-containing protein [Candidatus Woesearchaeota archaeon]|nr:PIN domain-containing protein [Candidatus Woesearchaeota archaeon]